MTTSISPPELIRYLATALLLSISAVSVGQNVSGYGTMKNPHLFLVREPAVQADLELSDKQQRQLDAVNRSLDARLLAARNKADAAAQFDAITVESQQQLATILNTKQRRRINEIRLRIRGWRSLLLPKIMDRLELTDKQRADVQAAVDAHDAVLESLQANIQAGKTTQAEAEVKSAEKLNEMQSRIKEVLTAEQVQSFLALVGQEFPLNRLYQVAFVAPEFSPSQKWLNSEPLSMEKLKGKVVALHFFAFA